MSRFIIVILTVGFYPFVYGDDFICHSGNEIRKITVEYQQRGWQVPCRVRYEKSDDQADDGQSEYPWSAQATTGYCEEKAAFLTGKLEHWGWVCSRTDSTD